MACLQLLDFLLQNIDPKIPVGLLNPLLPSGVHRYRPGRRPAASQEAGFSTEEQPSEAEEERGRPVTKPAWSLQEWRDIRDRL